VLGPGGITDQDLRGVTDQLARRPGGTEGGCCLLACCRRGAQLVPLASQPTRLLCSSPLLQANKFWPLVVSVAGALSGLATYAGYQREVKERRAAKERARTLLQSDVHDVKLAVQQLKQLQQAVQRVEQAVQRVEQAVHRVEQDAQQSRWEQRAVQLGLIMLLVKAYK
jgi:hypothetical protein